jgi:hypothetical protein
MRFVSWLVVDPYRHTVDGRRVVALPSLAPRRLWPTYIVGEDAVGRFEKRLRRSMVVLILGVLPLLVSVTLVLSMVTAVRTGIAPDVSPSIWYWLGVIILPPIAVRTLLQLWVFRGLDRTSIAPEEFVAVDLHARDIAHLRAIGTPVLVAAILTAGVMTALQVDVFLEYREWWAGAGTVILGASTLLLAQRLVVLRRAERRHRRSTAS